MKKISEISHSSWEVADFIDHDELKELAREWIKELENEDQDEDIICGACKIESCSCDGAIKFIKKYILEEL